MLQQHTEPRSPELFNIVQNVYEFTNLLGTTLKQGAKCLLKMGFLCNFAAGGNSEANYSDKFNKKQIS
jgi:hypothetical protein